MKRHALLLLILVVSVLNLSGCVVWSINKFFTKDLIVKVDGIKGDWKLITQCDEDVEHQQVNNWTFTDHQVYVYSAQGKYFGSGDMRNDFEVTFFKINNTILADVIAELSKPRRENGYFEFTVIPMHILMKVVIENDKLTLSPLLNTKGFMMHNNERIKSLTYVKYQGDDDFRLYTSTPEEWVEFLKKNLTDEQLFAECKFELRRVQNK